MYELIIYDKKKSYVIFGDSSNPKDYPTIPVGAIVFVLDTQKVYAKIGPGNVDQVDFENNTKPEPPDTDLKENTSILGPAIVGKMIIGM